MDKKLDKKLQDWQDTLREISKLPCERDKENSLRKVLQQDRYGYGEALIMLIKQKIEQTISPDSLSKWKCGKRPNLWKDALSRLVQKFGEDIESESKIESEKKMEENSVKQILDDLNPEKINSVGYIYIVKENRTPWTFKVGLSANVLNRWPTIQTGNVDAELDSIFKVKNMKEAEDLVHEGLEKINGITRIPRSEWFEVHWVKEICVENFRDTVLSLLKEKGHEYQVKEGECTKRGDKNRLYFQYEILASKNGKQRRVLGEITNK